MELFEWLEHRNIKVKDKDLIQRAFMHSSYANEHRNVEDNERLEFMGDAVLQLYSSEHIYQAYPEYREGQMTKLRAQLVCEKALAMYVRQLHLNEFLLLGSGEEKTGGREKDAILADMFEAFLGALYFDQGISAVDTILREVLVPCLKHPEKVGFVHDYKTLLQEYVQADDRKTVQYKLVEETGPSNAPTFLMHAIVDGLVLGIGKGSSKKQAEQAAAKDAFEKMVR